VALTKKSLWSCLRILLTIPIVLVICFVILYVTLSITSYKSSPIDANRFNTSRQYLSKDLPIDEIAPTQIGEFMRIDLTDDNAYLNYERAIRATYANSNGQRVDLSAFLGTPYSDKSFLSSQLGCGDCAGNPPAVYTDTDISYAYEFCSCWFFASHDIRWINGDWKLRASAASTLKSDGETLIKFVSSYPF
jgi:hypothetical protein